MALQKKKYRSSTNRSRGSGPGTPASLRSPKDYGKGIRSHHGSKADEAMDVLVKQIQRVKKFG
jgi:hypothetical protein